MSNLRSAALSAPQTGIYLDSKASPESTLYNLPFLATLGREVEIPRLQQALTAAIAAHPGLSARLSLDEDGRVVQTLSEEPLPVEVIELTDAEFETRRDHLVRPFDLDGGVLARIELYVTPSGSYLFEDMHHIIYDGTSWSILAADVRRAYDGETVPMEAMTGLDVAAADAALAGTDACAQAHDYWDHLLDGREPDCLPVRDNWEDVPRQGWLTHEFSLDANRLTALRHEIGTSTTAYFTAVMGLLVARYNYSEESVIATVHNGRADAAVQETISMLVHTFPYVTDITGNPAVRDLLTAAQAQITDSRANEGYPFEQLAGDYGVNADINFAYQGHVLMNEMMQGSGWPVTRLYDQAHIENTALLLELSELGEGRYALHVGYRADQYTRAFAENLAHAYAKAAQEMLVRTHVNEIQLADDAARAQIAAFHQNTVSYDRSLTVVDQFRAQAQAHPDKVAVVYQDVQLTYGALDRLTDRLARHLRSLGIDREHVVAILIPRCEYMVICSLGVSKACGAYLPLDPTYPPERLNLMVQDAGAEVLLTTPELSGIIDETYTGPRIMLEEIAAGSDFASDAGLPAPQPDDLFIMLYTSGSTGLPKGVMLEHRGLNAFCHWYHRRFDCDETIRAAAYASYGFDANMMDTYPALTMGGTVYIIPEDMRLDLTRLHAYYDEVGITHSFITTQVGRQFALMDAPRALRHFMTGGEKLVPIEPPKGYQMYNLYGPTETTIITTCQPMDRYCEDVPIGPANDNIRLYVVDRQGNLLPQGAAGELWISGVQVGRGYLNRPEQSAAAFTANPFSDDPDYSRVYHSGDVVRFMRDGRVQFIGRRDAQVKIRGFRIELTEVEEIIRRFPGITDATVAAFDDPAGGKYVAAYVVSDAPVDIDALNAFILAEKPPYMVPAVTMQIDHIPVNQNAKVNKRALPVPERRFEDVVPPQNPTQQRIYDIVADVVGSREFGIHTDLTMAGLTSIGSVRLNVLLAKAFGVPVTARELREYNTVARLEDYLTGAGGADAENVPGGASAHTDTEGSPAEDADGAAVGGDDAAAASSGAGHVHPMQEDYPLTKTQEGILVECLAHPDTTIYNIPVLLEIDDSIDLARLQSAVAAAVAAHPFIKTRLHPDAEGAVCLHRADEDPFKAADVEIREIDNIEDVKDHLVTPFALIGGRLFRTQILRSPAHNYLYLEFHHIICDGTSMQIFLDDVSAAYRGETPETETYSGYDAALTEARDRAGRYYQQAADYYAALLDGCDTESLPDGDLQEQEEPQSDRLDATSACDAEAVRAFCAAHQLGLNSYFTAALGLLLSRWEHKEDVVFAAIHNGRGDSRLSRTMSMLVQTYPVRCQAGRLEAARTAAEYIAAIGRQQLDSMTNDLYSFAEISHGYGVTADVLLAYQGDAFAYDSLCGAPARFLPLTLNQSKAPLNLEVSLAQGQIAYHCEYRSDRYSRAMIESLLDAYDMVLLQLLANPQLRTLSILSDKARAVLDGYQQNTVPYDHTHTVIDAFRELAQAHPDKVAVVYQDVQLTYGALDRMTDRLARHLRSLGIEREHVVGVLIPRCEYMVICSLGVLKAGGAYLPLDPTYPPERLNLMMQDAGAEVLLATPELSEIIDESYTGPRMMLEEIAALADALETGEAQGAAMADDGPAAGSDFASDAELPAPQPQDLFIMLYTSGSTGLPKGVMLEHGNLAEFCDWAHRYYHYDETSRAAAYASYGFDACMLDMYPVLTAGGTLYIIPQDMRLDLVAVQQYFNENGITHSFMTTQIGRQFALMEGTTSLQYLMVGGEKLVPLQPPTGYRMYNIYGPTECTINVTVQELDRYYEDIPIGPANDNLRLYIVDAYGNLLPQGAAGELLIAGPQVGRGYLNRPEQSAAAFTANPFCDDPEYSRVYHTGDVVRFLADGRVQFIGRRDAQVKVRGFRIELTEIEEIIRRYPGIQDATVAAYDDPAGGKYVAAYVVSDAPVDIEAMNAFILSEKPPYMVPAVTMQIERIPYNQNQKVNRRALPVPERKFEDVVPPQNETQQRIYDIVADVVGSHEFGIHTDLTMAGLTSIGSVRLNAMLAKAFDTHITTRDLKAYNTVARLEEFLTQVPGEGQQTRQDPLREQADYPLTKTQEGIFVECIAHPNTTVYNIPILLELSDAIDIGRLRDALVTAVQAHPYIKTRLFMNEAGDIRQRRMDEEPFTAEDIEVRDIDDIDETRRSLVTPFELLGGRLFRLQILRGKDHNYLFLEFHHIICDGTSMQIFLADISAAYRGETLAPEDYSGYEVALTEERERAGEAYTKARDYYATLMADADTESLPGGDLHEQAQAQSDNLRVYGSYSTAADVQDYCRTHHVSLNGFFSAVYGLVLSKFARKECITYATIYNGRSDSRLERTMTMLVKTFPVVCKVGKAEGGQRVADYIAAISRQLMDSQASDLYSFAEISHELAETSDVMFAYQGDQFAFDTLCGERVRSIPMETGAAKAPINLNVMLENGRIVYYCEYRSDRFSRAWVESLLDACDACTAQFLQDQTLREVSVLSDRARAQLAKWNATEGPVTPAPVPQLFERAVAENPDKVAVTCGGVSLTYAELNSRANRIANSLVARGLQGDTIVGLYMDRCVDVYAIHQGILKAGGAYMTVVPDYPDDRILYIYENSQSPFLITTRELYESRPSLFGQLQAEVLLLEDLYANENDENPGITINPEWLAYCIYTSGTTGRPKGAMVEHRNLMNMLSWHERNNLANDFLHDKHVIMAVAAFTFDMSVQEEMYPLTHGLSVAIATEEEIHNPLLLAQMMEATGVDMMKCTPAYMQTMLEFPEVCRVLRQLHGVVVGGEPFPETLYGRMRAAGITGEIYNSCGPTETTVSITIATLDGQKVTIGRPVGNTQIQMLDCYDQALPPYARGELLIIGKSVGRGYIGLPEMNREKYIAYDGQRAYRSGDIAYWDADGDIICLGRSDNQIKLRGFRIELDEIENVMNRYPGIKRSIVLVKGEGADQFLCGYYQADKAIDPDTLTQFCSETLAKYMVPAAFVHMSSFPMTGHGKVDKRALPEPAMQTQDHVGREPATDLERQFCEMFALALGRDKVYAEDDFFENGGTSLSASKVAMRCMMAQLPVAYQDVFHHTTPAALAAFVEERQGAAAGVDSAQADVNESAAAQAASENHADAGQAEGPAQTQAPGNGLPTDPYHDVLQYNTVDYVDGITSEALTSVLVTGATGFLGIHVVHELLTRGDAVVYCLVRGSIERGTERLKTYLEYYFENTYDELFGTRIVPIVGDITDAGLGEVLRGYGFDTIINCAACVKHFAADDSIERVNVGGVENLIRICMEQNRRLVQISTDSVAGESVNDSVPQGVVITEDRLWFGQSLDNQYIGSKYRAEEAIYQAIREGLRAKVIRVGNLMSRDSDGEFQMNYTTNGFMRMMRAYAILGVFPVSRADMPVEFSPIDATARAVVTLAGTPERYTVFHAFNWHFVHVAYVLDVMRRCGVDVRIVPDAEYQAVFEQALADERTNQDIAGLISYDSKSGDRRRFVGKSNSYSVKALYRLGFEWPMTDMGYMERAINALATLGFYDRKE